MLSRAVDGKPECANRGGAQNIGIAYNPGLPKVVQTSHGSRQDITANAVRGRLLKGQFHIADEGAVFLADLIVDAGLELLAVLDNAANAPGGKPIPGDCIIDGGGDNRRHVAKDN